MFLQVVACTGGEVGRAAWAPTPLIAGAKVPFQCDVSAPGPRLCSRNDTCLLPLCARHCLQGLGLVVQ